jgi:hypothetical protein
MEHPSQLTHHFHFIAIMTFLPKHSNRAGVGKDAFLLGLPESAFQEGGNAKPRDGERKRRPSLVQRLMTGGWHWQDVATVSHGGYAAILTVRRGPGGARRLAIFPFDSPSRRAGQKQHG